jgi:hypothetical protein
MFYLSFFLDILFGYLGALEVAVIRSLCKSVSLSVTNEPEDSFNFTFAPVMHLLPKFEREGHLLWVVQRMHYEECLLQYPASPSSGTYVPRKRWRNMGIHPRYRPTAEHSYRQLERLVRGFWLHPNVQVLRAAAIRLDSSSLLRRVAKEAPGLSYSGVSYADGESNFLYNCWIFIEETWQKEHGPWKPLMTDGSSAIGKVFFSKVHSVLWTYMKQVREGDGLEEAFNGFSSQYEYHICVSSDDDDDDDEALAQAD